MNCFATFMLTNFCERKFEPYAKISIVKINIPRQNRSKSNNVTRGTFVLECAFAALAFCIDTSIYLIVYKNYIYL